LLKDESWSRLRAPLPDWLNGHVFKCASRYQCFLDQYGETFVCSPYVKADSTWRPSQCVRELEAAIKSYLEIANQSPQPFVWTKTAERFWLLSCDFMARGPNQVCADWQKIN
jgi:hypothetical protein